MRRMKKLISVLLVLVMALALCPVTAGAAASDYRVGDKIQLGTYEQDDNNSNGKEPITWTILDKKGGKVLLLSEKCLDVRPYDTSEASVTWETSELRAWLNDEFLNAAFDSNEQGYIVETKNKNPKSASGISGGSDTDDMVFLLSARECESYLKSNSDRQAEPTDYAEGLGVDNEHKGPYCRWWLRTPGGSSTKAANVHAAGGINFNGKDNDIENIAVRPALWFDVTNYSTEAGISTAVDISTAADNSEDASTDASTDIAADDNADDTDASADNSTDISADARAVSSTDISIPQYTEGPQYNTGNDAPCAADLELVYSGDTDLPEDGDYLAAYEMSYVDGQGEGLMQVYSSAEGDKALTYAWDGTPVLVVARRAGRSCVLDFTLDEAYWLDDENLDRNYYLLYDPMGAPVRDTLQSWEDVTGISYTGGAIYALCGDGSVKSMRIKSNAADLRKWGDGIKSLYAPPSVSNSVIFGIEDYTVRIYGNDAWFYPSQKHVTEAMQDGTLNLESYEVRNIEGAKKIVGSPEYGYACLKENGRLIYVGPDSVVYMNDYMWTDSFAYYDVQDDCWYYVEKDSDSGKSTLYTAKDGKLDYDSGKDVTGDESYDIGKFTGDIVDVCGKYPDEAFTAIRAGGGIVLYGYMARHMLDDGEYANVSFNPDFHGVTQLIDQYLGITEDGRIISLTEDGKRPMLCYGEDADPAAGLHPEVYGKWKDIVYAVSDNTCLMGVTKGGEVLVDISGTENYDVDEAACGKYDVDDWTDVSSVYPHTDVENGTACTLGVTKDGKILIAGILPGE